MKLLFAMVISALALTAQAESGKKYNVAGVKNNTGRPIEIYSILIAYDDKGFGVQPEAPWIQLAPNAVYYLSLAHNQLHEKKSVVKTNLGTLRLSLRSYSLSDVDCTMPSGRKLKLAGNRSFATLYEQDGKVQDYGHLFCMSHSNGSIHCASPDFVDGSYIVEIDQTLAPTSGRLRAGAVATPPDFLEKISCGEFNAVEIKSTSKHERVVTQIQYGFDGKTEVEKHDAPELFLPANGTHIYMVPHNQLNLSTTLAWARPQLGFTFTAKSIKVKPTLCRVHLSPIVIELPADRKKGQLYMNQGGEKLENGEVICSTKVLGEDTQVFTCEAADEEKGGFRVEFSGTQVNPNMGTLYEVTVEGDKKLAPVACE